MRTFLLTVAMLLWVSLVCAQVLPADTRFIMSHFRADGGGGDERLYISISPDGLNWTALNDGQPVWQPANWAPFYNVVRDPSIIFANGFYWVAYTSGNVGAHASFGLVKSPDLLNWTFVGEISTAIPGGTNELTWGPFFFQDGDGSVHIFVSISPTAGVDFNPTPTMRSHELHPLDASFTQWSAPVPLNLPGTNTNEFWAWKEGTNYHAIYVDFLLGSSYIHVTATDLPGPWGNAQFLGFVAQEGGFVLPKPEGGYRFYVEAGNTGPSTGYRTCDFDATFTSHTAQVEVNRTVTMRNGKAMAASGTSTFAAWQAARLAAVAPADRLPNADPDRDGLANLVECALGTDPLAPSAAPLAFTRSVGGQTFAGLRFERLRQCADVTLQAEATGDLAAWGTGAITESVALLSDGTERVYVRDSLSTAAAPMRFLRLKATLTASPGPALQIAPTPARRAISGGLPVRKWKRPVPGKR